MKINSIYIIGSLRNPKIPKLTVELQELGLDVFSDWFGAGKIADDSWKRYEESRGRTYEQALKGHAAQHVFAFDKKHLDRCEAAVLLMPGGKSAHLELGYTIGKGKPGFILFDKSPSRWDVMCNFATEVYFDKQKLFDDLIARS